MFLIPINGIVNSAMHASLMEFGKASICITMLTSIRSQICEFSQICNLVKGVKQATKG